MTLPSLPSLPPSVYVAGMVAFVVAVLLVLTKRWHGRFGAFSVAFTAFAVAGVANAVNIIDGFNGLASGFVVIALLGFSAIASIAGDVDLALVSVVIAAAVVGFWLVNWPWGKLFLGDGGSYFVGFALAWISVLLVERNQGATPFVALLVCIHPVTEVLFSIFRRRMTRTSPGAPDRLHLHTLVMRRIVSPKLTCLFGMDREAVRRLRNPVTGIVIAALTCPAAEVPSDVWHTVIALESGCVLLETKAGPFDPDQPKDLAPWAPPEFSGDVSRYLKTLTQTVQSGVAENGTITRIFPH